MKRFGIEKEMSKQFIPPYEWYNVKIVEWTEDLGLKLISFTPGTKSNADYTIPSMKEKYISSNEIYNSILELEEDSPNGLNGFHLLLHVGTDPKREDKFYYKLGELLDELVKRGYSFKLFF